MSSRTSSVKRRFVPASELVRRLGEDLQRIKSEESLTWVDVGEALHKSDDMAAKYADGSAVMDFVTYLRGKDAWNGRFSGSVERSLESAREAVCPKSTQTLILQAAFELSIALQDDDLTDAEVHAMRPTLEAARDAIDAQLMRLIPKEVA